MRRDRGDPPPNTPDPSATTTGSSNTYWTATRASLSVPRTIATDERPTANDTNIPTRKTIPAAETMAETCSARQATRTIRSDADSAAGATTDVITTASRVLNGGEQRADDPLAVHVEEVIDPLAIGRVVALGPTTGVFEQRLVRADREAVRYPEASREPDRVVDLGRRQVREPEVLGLTVQLRQGHGHPRTGSGCVLIAGVRAIDHDAVMSRRRSERDDRDGERQGGASGDDAHGSDLRAGGRRRPSRRRM